MRPEFFSVLFAVLPPVLTTEPGWVLTKGRKAERQEMINEKNEEGRNAGR